jgi:hypothetical protein
MKATDATIKLVDEAIKRYSSALGAWSTRKGLAPLSKKMREADMTRRCSELRGIISTLKAQGVEPEPAWQPVWGMEI